MLCAEMAPKFDESLHTIGYTVQTFPAIDISGLGLVQKLHNPMSSSQSFNH
jgi:hypothetical protein